MSTRQAVVVTWESRIYASRWSRRVVGRLNIEGRTRAGAVKLLAELAETPVQAGDAAQGHARDVVSGALRHTMHRSVSRCGADWYYRQRSPAYLAQDGLWRGWGPEAWGQSPPQAYSRSALSQPPA